MGEVGIWQSPLGSVRGSKITMKVILVLTQHVKNVVYSASGLVSSGLVCVIKGKTKFGIVLVVFWAVTVALLLIPCVIVYEIFSLVTKDFSN